MKKKLIKGLVLFLTFLATATTVTMINSGPLQLDLRSDMAEPTLPVITLMSGEMEINTLYGYVGEMNPLAMRDTITPLPEWHRLLVRIQTFGEGRTVDSLSYMLRSLDNERLLEEDKLAFSQKGEGLIVELELPFQNLMEDGQEYLLILALESKGESISYYTRIVQAEYENNFIDRCLEFVKEFHEKTFDSENIPWLVTYMEPDSQANNTTLQTVTINSSMSQLTWRDFSGEKISEPIPSIKEIDVNYNSIVLNYVMASIGASGETEHYEVEEYFRVNTRSGAGRVFLLDYRRTMNEIFLGKESSIQDDKVLLGIRDPQVDFDSNESGTIASFVQQRDLWAYDSNNNYLSRMFSFREGDEIDVRADNPNHGLRIIRMDPAGNTDFVVYGYMNRGKHEGETGLMLYHFDNMSKTVQERAFLRSDQAYEVLKENWGGLFYVSTEGVFYLIIEGSMHGIDWRHGTKDVIFEHMNDEHYAVSENGRFLAYSENGTQILLMDLEMDQTKVIPGGHEELLRPIGFVGSDFVYGHARLSDRAPDGLLPMYHVTIIDQEGNPLKEYEVPGFYVAHAYVENDTIFLERVERQEETYVPTTRDSIKATDPQTFRSVKVGTESAGAKQTIVTLEGSWRLPSTKLQVIAAKEMGQNSFESEISPSAEASPVRYYVYQAGRVIFSSQDPALAIQHADAAAGVVVDENLAYIWRRGRRATATVPESAYLGETELVAIREGRPLSDARILNLTGCSVSQMLYFVNLGIPVYAIGEGGQELLIVGHDAQNTTLYNPATGAINIKGLEDSDVFFGNAGNRFIVVLH